MSTSKVVYLPHQAGERLGYTPFEMLAITRAKLLRKRRTKCVDYYRERDLMVFEYRREHELEFKIDITFAIITLAIDLSYVNHPIEII